MKERIKEFLRWLHQFEKHWLYPIFEEYFVVGTKKSFVLHSFLLWSNVFLFAIAVLELLLHHDHHLVQYFYLVELIFGIFYLVEFVLKSIYISIPNRTFGGFFMVINFVVIISLIVPQFFGNIAILRVIRSMKLIKIFRFNKELEDEKKIMAEK